MRNSWQGARHSQLGTVNHLRYRSDSLPLCFPCACALVAPLHTSFTLFRRVPGCLVKETFQLMESRLTRASVCALAEINQELNTPLQQPSIIPRRRAVEQKRSEALLWKMTHSRACLWARELVWNSEKLIWSVKGTCFFRGSLAAAHRVRHSNEKIDVDAPNFKMDAY